ncbi:MAG: LuxR C-terminal-related transcriptional regulator [Desulfotomaculaceae bacterium]|nr:LuxR C-terminal-related transcriptional regulator [Desulfotomaculaceae bacterium]
MSIKLFEPKLLHRQRINNLLEGIFNVPLLFLISSMGYGKTTAVKSFLGAQKNLQYTWLSLYNYENDEIWLWQKFCQSLAGIDSELSKRLAQYGLPKTVLDREYILDIIQNTITRRTVLVIDDYQENKNPSIDLLLTIIARASIPQLHILIISRSYPEMPINELELKGLCRELSQDRFEFTREETVELFRQNGFQLSAEEQTLLCNITDGWVAAIYLSLIKYAENQTFEDIQQITRLVKTAVYDKFDPNTQETLLKLSPLDNFGLEEAMFISENQTAPQLIRKLTTNNCFIRYDNISRTYALHALLRTTLQEQFVFADIDKPGLFSRCGDWHARSNRYIEAVDFYHRAGSYEKILNIFEKPGSAEVFDLAPKTIISAFNDMDKQLKLSRPLAYITYIYCYLVSVDAREGAELLYEAKAIYEADDSLIDKEQILGEIALAESFLQFNDAPLMNECYKRAYTLFGGTSSRISNPEAIFTFGSPHTLYLYHKDEGKLLTLVEIIENDIKYYNHVANGCGTGFEHTARAEYYLETGDLSNAELFAYKAIFKAKTRNQLCLVICGNLCLARLALLNGKPGEAFSLLEELRAEVEAAANPVLLNSIDLAAGYIYGNLGRLKQIPYWLQDGDFSRCNLYYQGTGNNYITIGQVAVLRKSFAELEIIAETMQETYKPKNHIFGLIFAGIYDAIAKKHLYGLEKSRQALLPTIKLASADGIITPFAENIPELHSVLQSIPPAGNNRWITQVLDLGERFMHSWQLVSNQEESPPLTGREIEVLTLLEKGCTQKEIAERLYLSQNTVRRHLQNIYEKLGVKNKTLAIKKAKELNLLLVDQK